MCPIIKSNLINFSVDSRSRASAISTRSHYKRSADEMMGPEDHHDRPLVIDEGINKRSRLEEMLQQSQPSPQVRRPTAHYQTYSPVFKMEAGYNPSPWDPRQLLQSPAAVLASVVEPCNNNSSSNNVVPTAQSVLSSDLKRELTLPAPSTRNHETCSVGSISAGSSSWSNADHPPPPSNAAAQPENFDDSGWITGDESFNDFTTGSWKQSVQQSNVKQQSHNLLNPSIAANNAASTSAYFEEDIFGATPYHPDELINHVQPITGEPATSVFDSSYADMNRPISHWCGMLAQGPLPPKPLPSLICSFDYAGQNCDSVSLFRTQRPGNPLPIVVHSGRGVIYPTFCLTLPRVASYIQ